MSKEIKASDFYPITTIKYPDGHELTIILRPHLKDYTPPIKYESLMTHLTGQTGTVDGVYVGDVEDWLNNKPSLD
jgi:hypothetical protein